VNPQLQQAMGESVIQTFDPFPLSPFLYLLFSRRLGSLASCSAGKEVQGDALRWIQ